jgi:iron(III) transport system permease protein
MSIRERLAALADAVADGTGTDTGMTLLTAAIAAALVLPLGWLVIDVVGLGGEALALAVSSTTLGVLARSVALVVVVTGASVGVGVPLAVLTVQADIPFGRFWTVLAALPLTVPS